MSMFDEKEIEEIVKMISEEVNTITPIYGLAFVKKENNESYPFADFYGKSFLPVSFDKKTVQKECDENNIELVAMLGEIEKDIMAQFESEGIIKSDLNLDVRLVQLGGYMHEQHSKFINALTCETKEDAIKKFKYYYAESKMTKEEKKEKQEAQLKTIEDIIKLI